MIYILNFSNHPFTEGSKEALRKRFRFGYEIVPLGNFKWDNQKDFCKQVDDILAPASHLLDGTKALVVNLPGLSVVSGLLLARIHGLTGGFPRILNLGRTPEGLFEVDQVIDLQGVRDEARFKRMAS